MVGKSYKKTEEDIIAEKRRKAKLNNKPVDLSPSTNSDRVSPGRDKMRRSTTTSEEDAGMKNTKKTAAELNKNARKTKDTPKKAELSDYESQLKALLANKDKLVKQDSGDGRNKYSYQINQLTKRMKAEGLKFKSLLRDVKKQEREGTFDRGAEGKAKNALRKKMYKERNPTQQTGPRAK